MSVLDRNVVDFGHEDDDKVTVRELSRRNAYGYEWNLSER
jgi:hypothetical protein